MAAPGLFFFFWGGQMTPDCDRNRKRKGTNCSAISLTRWVGLVCNGDAAVRSSRHCMTLGLLKGLFQPPPSPHSSLRPRGQADRHGHAGFPVCGHASANQASVHPHCMTLDYSYVKRTSASSGMTGVCKPSRSKIALEPSRCSSRPTPLGSVAWSTGGVISWPAPSGS